jgi:hypothetical protein
MRKVKRMKKTRTSGDAVDSVRARARGCVRVCVVSSEGKNDLDGKSDVGWNDETQKWEREDSEC